MTLAAVLLISASAFLHVFYNILFKRECEDVSFVPSMVFAECVLLLAPFILCLILVDMPLSSLLYAVGGGIFNGLYFFCLANAYRRADFTLVYPVARSAPVFLVTWAAMLLGDIPSAMGLAGIFAVVGGCFLLPLKGLLPGRTGFSFKSYLNKTSIWALATALMTSFYSIFDKLGMRLAPGILEACYYIFCEFFISMVIVFILSRLIDREKKPLRYLAQKPIKAMLTAFFCSAGYILVLLAFQTPSKVSYVVGFRQLSIVIGVIFGGLFLNEKVTFARLVGALVIFGGLLLIAFAS